MFRVATVDEEPARTLLAEYFQQRVDGFDRSAGDYQVTLPDPARFVGAAGVFLVVEAGDVPVGCGGIRMLDAHRAEVKHLYLRETTRGRGWGALLLAELEQRARALGATEAVLDTNATLLAAGGLYRSAGYSEIAPYNDNPNATLWFRKEFTPGQ